MAKIQTVQIIDDIDGKVLDKYETVRWAIDGTEYEFDTSVKHAQQFRDAVAKYLDVSRLADTAKPTPSRRRLPATAGNRSKEQTLAIRAWAIKNGYEVSSRGRIPAGILEAFEAAH